MRPIHDLGTAAEEAVQSLQFDKAAYFFELKAQQNSTYYANAAWAYLAINHFEKARILFDLVDGAPEIISKLLQEDDFKQRFLIVEALLKYEKKLMANFCYEELISLKKILTKSIE